jgi:hypothetical protein
MKSLAYFLFLLFIFTSCTNRENQSGIPENDIDAAREFIRAALDGKFDAARKYLLPDSLNTQYMDAAERSYNKSDNDTKNGYRAASINIHKIDPLNDSTTIVIFSNSFKNDRDTLKVLRMNGQWQVDLKYLYLHDMDTLAYSIKDSLK